jgi:CHAT domain-containing protein
MLRAVALILVASAVVCAQLTGRDSASGSASEQSLAIYETAVEVAGQLHDPKLLGKSYYNLAAKYLEVNKIDKAIDAYKRSGQSFKEAGLLRDLIYIYGDLGALFFNQENFHKAREYSEESIRTADSIKNINIAPGAWPDDFGRARALHTLAEMDLHEGNQAAAIDKLQQSLRLYQHLNGEGSHYNVSIAGVYAALGKVYPELGDYASGLLHLNKALRLAEDSTDRDTTANILNSIGYLYMEQEDYDQARVNFQRSLKIYLAENNQIEAAKLHLNLGVIEQRQAHYDEALALFNLSFKEAKAAQITDAQLAANEGIGVVLSAKRDFTGALEALNQSLALAKETKNRTREIELLWRTAQAYLGMQDYARATNTAEGARLLAHTMRLPKLEYLATTTLGQSYAAQGNSDLAIQTLKEAIDQLESMRNGVAGREIERQMFLENKIASYHSLVGLFVKQNRPVEALLYAERAKGRVLLDVVRSGKTDLAKALTANEKEQLQRLNRRISEVNDSINKQPAEFASLKSLYEQLDAARLDYRSFEDALYGAHPELRIRSGQTAPLTNDDINALTGASDTAYLEYVVTETSVSVLVLRRSNSIGSADVTSYSIATKPEDLARKVNQFRDRLANRHPDYIGAARELYSSLIEPAAKQIEGVSTICIIPDSFLWNLPFQALMPMNDHFLIEDRALYYAPSLSALREMNREEATSDKTDSSLIAFGNPVIGKDEQRNADLCPLPEAEQEVTSIARTFDPKISKVLIGREAAEKSFKALAPTYSIIHLATHGIIDNRQPLYSYLLLTKTEGDPENDGRLEARQIMEMNLDADLAVLSACETADGRISPGEGVIGLSWAFFLAGTRSLVVSQWNVNSQATSKLMLDFYQVMKTNNMSKATKVGSLRQSELGLLNETRYRHPFYWAAFALIGRQ